MIDARGGEDHAANTIVQADTLEELAEKMGVPAVNLVKTVEEWNGYCDGEFDPDFGRQVDFGKIQTPPFYADIYKPFVLGTAGGLRTDTNAQVVDVNGDPIPGLYAAGMIITVLPRVRLGHPQHRALGPQGRPADCRARKLGVTTSWNK